MKKIPSMLLAAAITAVLGACAADTADGASNAAAVSATSAAASVAASASYTPPGRFTATLGERSYDVAVECSYLEQDYFQFKSDKTDITDSNGDGLIISGFQDGKTLTLGIIDQGVNFSTPGLDTFTKSAAGISGGGEMWEEGATDPKSLPVAFTVECG